MASVPYDTNKLSSYNDDYNNAKEDKNNTMLYVMGDLIKTMQQVIIEFRNIINYIIN